MEEPYNNEQGNNTVYQSLANDLEIQDVNDVNVQMTGE